MYVGSKRKWRGNSTYFGSPNSRNYKLVEQTAWKEAVKERPETFVFEILHSCNYDDITIRELNELEEIIQKAFNVVKSKDYINASYANHKFGGSSSNQIGRKHSKESKQKMSTSSMREKLSNETLHKMSVANSNRIYTDDWRKNIGLALKGYKHSDKAKKNMSDAQLARQYKHSDEAKIEVRIANTGRVHSDETKHLMSESHKGKVTSDATKALISKAKKSQPVWHMNTTLINTITSETIVIQWRNRKTYSNIEYKMLYPEKWCHLFNT